MAKIICPKCKSKMIEIKKGLHVCPLCKTETKEEDV